MRNGSGDFKRIDRVLESTHERTGHLLDTSVREYAEPAAVAEPLVALLDPDSFAADQYRALRHYVELRRNESDLRMLAVTSPGPGDGKTITTINLAGVMAQGLDAQVLVVDADLRRPRVADYLGLPAASPGLAELLDDSSLELDGAIRRVQGSNLSVLPAGSARVSAYKLLSSPRLGALLTELRRRFDWIFVDTPPIVAVPDGRIVSKSVDGFLIIVAAHKTPQKFVADALNVVDPAKVIGIVFNGDDRPLANRYGYYGRYYHTANRHVSWWRQILNLDRDRPVRRPSR
jgi:capsular exopolysaccharide synthesis family protein